MMAETTSMDIDKEIQTSVDNNIGTPWVERYRPNTLNEVSHQTEVVSTIKNAVETGRLPHLLFYGPPGTGKTSVALALCKSLWEPSQIKRRVLELNASDERGISVVRDKIKHFASLSVGTSTNRASSSSTNKKTGSAKNFFSSKKSTDTENDDPQTTTTTTTTTTNAKGSKSTSSSSYPNPPFKIIILDEADTVTPDAQAALRRIIEAHSRITRFILICNYVTRIIEPLASRCAKFRFQALPPATMKQRLVDIATSENCTSITNNNNDNIIDSILEHSNGDMRRAVNTLQSIHALSGGGGSGATGGGMLIDKDSIAEMAGLPPSTVVDKLWTSLHSKQFKDAEAAVDDVCNDGYSAQILLTSLLEKVIEADTETELNEISKSNICIKIAECEKNMIDGADEYLQLMTVCTLMQRSFDASSRKKSM